MNGESIPASITKRNEEISKQKYPADFQQDI